MLYFKVKTVLNSLELQKFSKRGRKLFTSKNLFPDAIMEKYIRQTLVFM